MAESEEYWQPEKLPEPQWSGVFSGGESGGWKQPRDWPQLLNLQPLQRSNWYSGVQSPAINHSVGVTIRAGSGLPVYKDTLTQERIPVSRKPNLSLGCAEFEPAHACWINCLLHNERPMLAELTLHTGLITMNFFSFCLPEKVLLSPYFWKILALDIEFWADSVLFSIL